MCTESMSDHDLRSDTHERARGPHLMGRARVLIVEDEADLAWVEQFNLEEEGYEVQVAPEGRTAIEQLELFIPHVLVLDVMLPHVDGWGVLAHAQELPAKQRPKVILVSAVA